MIIITIILGTVLYNALLDRELKVDYQLFFRQYKKWVTMMKNIKNSLKLIRNLFEHKWLHRTVPIFNGNDPIVKMVVFGLLVINALIFVGSANGESDPAEVESAFQKGICFVTWQKDRYLSPYSDRALERLAQTGATWVSIVTTYYQEDFDSLKIFPTENTPSDSSIIHAINKAHQLRLKIMLKPHLDLLSSSGTLSRSDIGFQREADWRKWFSQYLKFILHYAKLAERYNVDMLCIGTELCFASTKTKYWQEQIIPEIKKVYSGKLIYAANWDTYKAIAFWNQLDYIGIDAYFPLTDKENPNLEQIKAGWKKWIDQIQVWQQNINKPIILTEIGYRSCCSAAMKPWEFDSNSQLDSYRYRAPVVMGPRLKAEFPEVLEFARLEPQGNWAFSYQSREFKAANSYQADASFLSMFSFSFLEGNPENRNEFQPQKTGMAGEQTGGIGGRRGPGPADQAAQPSGEKTRFRELPHDGPGAR